MKSLAWGLPNLIPDDAVAAWGARAILRQGVLDFPRDRCDAFGDEGEKLVFSRWLSRHGFPWLDEDIAFSAKGNEARLYSLDDGRFHMRANTNASYGYLYVTAWMDK